MTPSRHATTARLAVEPLEDRTTPAGGLLDPTFGSGGIVTNAASPFRAFDVAVQTDGKVVAAGFTGTAKNGDNFAVARYNPDGSRDASFGAGGLANTDFRNYSDIGRAVAVQADGKVVVAGWTFTFQGGKRPSDVAIARYNPDGTLDGTFGNKGKVVTDLGGEGDGAEAVVVQPDGKIVVAGTSAANGYTLALARYTAAGALDPSFGSGGKLVTGIPTTGPGHVTNYTHGVALALRPDGKAVVATGTPSGDFVVARVTPGGAIDPTFGAGGTVTTDFAGGKDRVSGLALQTDGRVVVVGSSEGSALAPNPWVHFAVARYTPDGAPDAGFGQNGLVVAVPDRDPTGGSDPSRDTAGKAADVAIQTDGRILVAGAAQYRAMPNMFTLLRLNPGGTPDTSYGTLGTGWVMTPLGTGAEASGIALQPDGRAVLAGRSYSIAGDAILARYLPSGPTIGSFTAAPNPVTVGDPVTLTAGSIANGNPGAAVTSVAFYRDSNGDGKLDAADELLGSGTANGNGTWSLTFSTAGWAAGTYTLLARATDSYGAPGDPAALVVELG